MGMVGVCYQPYRKKKMTNNLCIYHNPLSTEVNKSASNTFKMTIYGEVTVATTSNEQSWQPRTRFVPYTLDAFEAEFNKVTRKRKCDFEEMRGELNKFEATVAKDAKKPSELAGMMKMPLSKGKDLAKHARSLAGDM